MKFKFKTSINCGSCVQSITPFLNELDNIDYWKVDTDSEDKILEVELDDEDVDSVIKAVESAGYTISQL